MKRSSLQSAFASACIAWTAIAFGAPEDWRDSDPTGWHFYVDPPVEEELEEEPEPPPVVPSPPPPAETAAEPAEPAMLSTEWIRINLPIYLDRAQDNPTSQNVRAYFALQKLAVERAQAFADVAQRVTVSDPLLDESTRRPFASYAANAATSRATSAKRRLVAAIGSEAGLWYFYRSDCSYCTQFGPVLSGLARTHGYKVLPISLDGKAPPSGDFPEFVTDQGQAAQLGVESTPSVYLVHPERNEVLPVAFGILAFTELESRILLAAHHAGWITDDQYNQTRPLSPTTDGILNPESVQQRLAEVIAQHEAGLNPATSTPITGSSP